MPTAYWAGGASGATTDTNNAANWVDAANGTNAFGSVPDGNDDVIIQSTSNSNVSHNPTQTAAHTFNSIHIESGGHWTADGSNHLTLNGENGSHFAFGNDGTFTHTNGTVVINNGGSMSHAAIRNGIATSTTGFYDLTISGGGTTCEIYGDTTIHRNMEAGGATTVLRGALTVNGNLTIPATLNTQYSSTDRNLTVAGKTELNGSGATLTLNDSTCSFGSGATVGGLTVSAGSTTVTAGGSSNITFGSIYATYDGSVNIRLEGTNTVNSYDASNDRIIRLPSATVDADSAFTVTTTTTDKRLSVYDANISLTLTPSSATNYFIYNANGMDVKALTINANATLNCKNSASGSDRDLTVAELCTVNGTLTGNSSAISAGGFLVGSSGKYNATSGTTTITSEDSTGYAWDVNGTDSFDNNNGTVLFDLSAFGMDTHVRTGQSDGANSFHHLTVLLNASTNTFTMRPNTGTAMTVEGDLTIQEGVFQKNTHSHTLTVTGDVSIESGGKIDATSASGANNFGSLTIASGGTYTATSGTTTLTGKTSSGNYSLDNQGTFTNNSGTIKVTGDGGHIREQGTGDINNLIVELGGSSENHRLSDSTTVGGTLTIVEGDFQPNGRNLTVTGDVSIESGGTITGSSGAMSFGSLEIASGGTYSATSGTTTITNKNSSDYMFFDAGTFTHNNGTVHFKADTSSGTWYAVKGHSTEDTTEFYNVTTERVGSSVGNYRVCVGGSNQFFTVRNNLTVGANCKIFSGNGSSIVRHSGLATLNGELDLDNFTDIEMGAVTINSGGALEMDNGSITLKAESFRNVGGTINA
jgi:fibronectin-binding autotransporter adhesin